MEGGREGGRGGGRMEEGGGRREQERRRGGGDKDGGGEGSRDPLPGTLFPGLSVGIVSTDPFPGPFPRRFPFWDHARFEGDVML